MSILGNIAKAALAGPRAMLGADGESDTLSIASGEEWKVTRAEARTGRDYELGGQQIEVTQTAVGETAEFAERYSGTDQSYLGKTAVIGDDTFRIAYINRGEAFTEIGLAGEEDAP